MKVRSVCPSCGRYFGRWYGLRTKDIRCPACGVLVRETGRTTAAAVALGMVISAFYIAVRTGLITWLAFALIAAALLLLGFVVHPYVVAYRQTSLGPICGKCHYVLIGVRGNWCPECGAEIDVTVDEASE